MINHAVRFALRQKLLVLLVVGFICVGGGMSFEHMPVDAYPDLAPPRVEIITQWPGHAAEEIERLVTVPTEIEMNGVPKLVVMRSISLYGLSDVILTFDDSSDDYFARQVVFERFSEITYHDRRRANARATRQPIRTRLPLRTRKPGPHAAGTEGLRRLGHRARI